MPEPSGDVVAQSLGPVTMLFTDIEGSTALARALGERWPGVLARHHEILSAAIAEHRGEVEGTEGDAFFALFADAGDAARAAVGAQRALRDEPWQARSPSVRMGLHTGAVERHVTGTVGLEIHRAARIAAAANGGQILLSEEAVHAAGDAVVTEDLGLHRLKDFPVPEPLYCAVVDGVGSEAFPPPRSLDVRPTNMPADERPLIGRSAALAAITSAFVDEQERLVTLTGLGGAGKTRLAIAAGTALLDEYPGGVWWVPLAAATDVAGALAALVSATGMTDSSDRELLHALADRLGARPTLIVLDNVEQIADIGPVLGALLERAPSLRILATSRLPLHLTRERVLPIDPLDADASRELVTSVVARVRPDLRLDDDALAALDTVCSRLDHHPLALELAAARLAILDPSQLLERVTTSLDLLQADSRDRPERHRSLRATLDWTLALLEPGPRALFTRLGVFAAAARFADLETVFGPTILDDLAALLDAGVLRRRNDGVAVRFALPQALRFIAVEELEREPDAAQWRHRHAAHVADLLWEAEAGGATAAAFDRALELEAEARHALAWATSAEPELADRIAAALATQLSDKGRSREALELADRVLAAGAADARVRAMALIARGHSSIVVGDSERCRQALTEARALLKDDDVLRGIACTLLAMNAGVVERDHPAARAFLDEALAVAEAADSASLRAFVLMFLAQDQLVAGEPAVASATLDEALALADACDAKARWYLDTLRGDVELALGRPVEALAGHLASVLAAFRRGDELQAYFDLRGLAEALAVAGRHLEALEMLGLAEGLQAEMSVEASLHWHAVADTGHVALALEAAGPHSEATIAAGRIVPAARRGVRARELVAAAT